MPPGVAVAIRSGSGENASGVFSPATAKLTVEIHFGVLLASWLGTSLASVLLSGGLQAVLATWARVA